jgi:hypothetical protein
MGNVAIIGCAGAGRTGTLIAALAEYYKVAESDVKVFETIEDMGIVEDVICVQVQETEGNFVPLELPTRCEANTILLNALLSESRRIPSVEEYASIHYSSERSSKLNGKDMSRLGSKKKKKPWE